MIHFKDYERYHQNPKNKMTHVVGIPLVLFSLVGLLAHVVLWVPNPESLFRIDLGILLFLAGAIYSIRLDAKFSVPYLLYAYFNYLTARHLSLPLLFGLQAFAWILQLVGHFHYEKKSPAFLDNLSQLLLGPMWMFAWIIGYYRPTHS